MTTLPTSSTRAHNPTPAVATRRHLLTPLSEPGHFLFIIDNSAAERFPCPTLARNYLVHGREPHPTNAALNFGGAVHVGIETLLRGPQPRVTEVTEDGLSVIHDEDGPALLRRAQQNLTNYLTSHPLPLDEYRTQANALEVIRVYQQRLTFPDYAQEICVDTNGPMIERAFELPLGVLEAGAWVKMPWLDKEFRLTNCKHFRDEFPPMDGESCFVIAIHVAWAGRIDVIARHLGRAPAVQDHKTSSQAKGAKKNDFLNDFLLSSQTRGYVWAARQLWPELNVQDFCLDAIQLSRPANGCGLLDRGPRGGEPALDLFRHYFHYEPAAIDSWAHNTMTRIEMFISCLVSGEFPMEATYCFNRKYGRCPYHDVCCEEIKNPAVALRLLHSEMFRDVTWNPTSNR